ncbi:hypothetical protein LCGC14_0481550 [marine sediment metagenome]|uniref:Uncharacterized protein n=1 Tax=marine sediment metagenome TaxID=412755 RepID=A0A0F9S960_9ZZZZ
MTRQFSRREILRAAALGGVFIAGEFWFPGQKANLNPPTWNTCATTGWEHDHLRRLVGLHRKEYVDTPRRSVVHKPPYGMLRREGG